MPDAVICERLRTGITASDVDDVLLGQASPNGEAPALGRVAALDASLGIDVPGQQLDRRYGSLSRMLHQPRRPGRPRRRLPPKSRTDAVAGQVYTTTGANLVVNYGSNKVRFVNPVLVDTDVRLRPHFVSVSI